MHATKKIVEIAREDPDLLAPALGDRIPEEELTRICDDPHLEADEKLCESARKNGIRITALDVEHEEARHSAGSDRGLGARNLNWARVISKVLSQPGTKMLIQGGCDHLGYQTPTTVNRILRDVYGFLGNSLVTYIIAGPTRLDKLAVRGRRGLGLTIPLVAEALDFANVPFMLRTGRQKRKFGADLLIYLPSPF